MKFVGYMVRYNEIALKGANRSVFEKKLVKNIKRKLKASAAIGTDLGEAFKVERLWGRILVTVECSEAVWKSLSTVMGISSFSPILQAPCTIESIKKEGVRLVMAALEKYPSERSVSIKVDTKRVDKSFPITSPEVSHQVAWQILDQLGNERLSVDLKQPELTLGIEIREEGAFLNAEKHKGFDGLPVGSSAKVLTLLSGGIDSPVAAWSMIRRGCPTDFIHFHSYPFTSEQSQQKVIQLAKKVSAFQNFSTLYMIAFGEIQQAIQKECDERYRVLLYRRIMQRIATHVAETAGAYALVTGESIGQVASQTVENLAAVEKATPMTILRPLITNDKDDTIAIAKKIGTFDISIQPFDDCCTLFQPKNPATKAKAAKLKEQEERLPVSQLVEQAISSLEEIKI